MDHRHKTDRSTHLKMLDDYGMSYPTLRRNSFKHFENCISCKLYNIVVTIGNKAESLETHVKFRPPPGHWFSPIDILNHSDCSAHPQPEVPSVARS